MTNALAFLDQRRSVPAHRLGEPAPDADRLAALLRAAIRVPDHGKLVPWRLLTIRRPALARLGERLAALQARRDPQAGDGVLDKTRRRFGGDAPLVIVVIARVDPGHPKIPEQEQLLSAGCVAYNLLLGAQALGFGAQWLTGWAAYDEEAGALLGLGANERVVGFIHVGTATEPAPERTRPAFAEVVGEWTG
jgi:nitroreductase